jgi:hypothetical protein
MSNPLKLLLCTLFMWVSLLTGCQPSDALRFEKEGISPGEVNKWGDPNFRIMAVGAYNYTDYDIYGSYLLPLEKNDIDYAAHAAGGRAQPPDSAGWERTRSGPGLAWDKRWATPRKFKVWWHRITDMALYKQSLPYPKGGGMFDPFDPYTSKQTRPGSAWCEGEVEIREQFDELFGEPYPYRRRDEMTLYFYPDGTVQGHLEFAADSEIKLVDIAKRNELPKLTDRACLKEVANPFFGKKRPISMN